MGAAVEKMTSVVGAISRASLTSPNRPAFEPATRAYTAPDTPSDQFSLVVRDFSCAPTAQCTGPVFCTVAVDEVFQFKTVAIDLLTESWPAESLMVNSDSLVSVLFYETDAMSSDYIGGITIDLNKIEFIPPNQDALIALANVRTDLADATKSYVSGSFQCVLERPWAPVPYEQQEPEPLARRSTIYDHYPLMQQLPERQRNPKNSVPPTSECKPNPTNTGMTLERNQWFQDRWKGFRATQELLPASHPADFRAQFVASKTAEGTAALMREHQKQVAEYQETSKQRAEQREMKKMEVVRAAEREAVLREQERLQWERQKNVKQQATSMMITARTDPKCWVQDGNNMTAVGVPYLHVGGQARLQAGTYTLVWSVRIEKDASLEDLTFEIYVPSNETEEMGDNTRIYEKWKTLDISRSRGKGFKEFEAGTFTIDKAPSDTVQFKIWNTSKRTKRGLTLNHCEFRAH